MSEVFGLYVGSDSTEIGICALVMELLQFGFIPLRVFRVVIRYVLAPIFLCFCEMVYSSDDLLLLVF